MPSSNDFGGFDMSGLERSADGDLLAAHKHCSHNREALIRSGKGACFYCFRDFATEQIVKWVDGGSTALCPFCEIDSVLSSSTQTTDQQFLRTMIVGLGKPCA